MKIIITLSTLFLITSCSSDYQKESLKSAKHNSASSRINSSQSNSEKISQELDE